MRLHHPPRDRGHVRRRDLDPLDRLGRRHGRAGARRQRRFDAAAAMGFVLQVVEPPSQRAGGRHAGTGLFGRQRQDRRRLRPGRRAGRAPTIAHYRGEGLELVPGSGLLATVRSRRLRRLDADAAGLRHLGRCATSSSPPSTTPTRATRCWPACPRPSRGWRTSSARRWPTSVPVWLPNDAVPQPQALFANPALARTWERIAKEADAATGREAGIEAARAAFSSGFVAEAIGDFLNDAEVMDVSGRGPQGRADA